MVPLKKTSLDHYLSLLKKNTKSNRLFQKEKIYRSRQKKRIKILNLLTISLSEEILFHPMSPNYGILPGPIFLSEPTTSMLTPWLFYPINRSEIMTDKRLPRGQPLFYKKKNFQTNFHNPFSFYSHFYRHYAYSIPGINFWFSSFFILFPHYFYSKTLPVTLPTSGSYQPSVLVPRQRRLISQSQWDSVRITSRHVSITLFFFHSTNNRTRTNGSTRYHTHFPYFLQRYLAKPLYFPSFFCDITPECSPPPEIIG